MFKYSSASALCTDASGPLLIFHMGIYEPDTSLKCWMS